MGEPRDTRDIDLICPRKHCPVESMTVRFVTRETAFNATGGSGWRCSFCGGRLRERELFPLPGEEAEALIQRLGKAAPWWRGPKGGA